jgi:uncharacterized protein with HEPN domain
MSRDDVYLLDILESAPIALAYVVGKLWDDFYEDRQCQDGSRGIAILFQLRFHYLHQLEPSPQSLFLVRELM